MDIGEIIQQAAPRQSPGIPPERVMAAISQEINAEGTISEQFGDTLFIAHPTGRPEMFIFRALNADNPRNYIQNVLMFFQMMLEEYGAQVLITEFKDPSIINIAKAIHQQLGRNAPLEFAVQRTTDGGYRMTVLLKGARQ